MVYHSFKKDGLEKLEIDMVEEIEYEDKCELLKLDISTTNCVIKHASYTELSRQEYSKQYKALHREELREKNRVYNEANKEKRRQPYHCECESVVRITARARHGRTKTPRFSQELNTNYFCVYGNIDKVAFKIVKGNCLIRGVYDFCQSSIS
ncbi:unnamed protein product [Phytophthora lilii]|uniref:Unnamed protein product n=1 Tax=Phytophthora lilii TaxID=2077276 RepID=A0A9W6XFI9_9STRA|nr:unnamed protein product [Phytophthora lilii]